MTSFRDVQNLLLLSRGSNFVEDEEFLILYGLFEPRNPDFPHEAYAKFDLDEMAESAFSAIDSHSWPLSVLLILKWYGSSTRTSRHTAMSWSLFQTKVGFLSKYK